MTAIQALPLVLGLGQNGICMSTEEFDAVTEYCVINRFERNMTVFRKTAPAGFVELVVSEKQVHRCELLPGFELNLARLFASADRWEIRE
jgi:Uma2 family endonuclease